MRFLIVDDNAHMIHIVKTILRGFGADKILEAKAPADAFTRLHESIDIVITDFQMAVLDGVEFVSLVRNSSDSCIRRATGGESGLLESRDHGFFTVDMPNFWERPEMANMLRNVKDKPDKYAWLNNRPAPIATQPKPIPALPAPQAFVQDDPDHEILKILKGLGTTSKMH